MRLLQQSELRVKRSRYFPKDRSQPFVVTFLQALISFKRLAKRLKQKVVSTRLVYDEDRHKKSYLDYEVVKAHNTREGAKFGAPVITLTNIRPPVLAVTKYRDIDTGHVFEDVYEMREAEAKTYVELKRPFISSKKKRAAILHTYVSNRVEESKHTMALGDSGVVPKRLKRKLKRTHDEHTKELHRKLGEHHNHDKHHKRKSLQHNNTSKEFASTHNKGRREEDARRLNKDGLHEKNQHNHHEIDHDDEDGVDKGEVTVGGKKVGDDKSMEKYIEYIPGTEIYYGSGISLQARHGGFLSFHDDTAIKASAHKTLPTARYVILKSSDLSNKGAVKYGDAVWLQGQSSEVLGACFSGSITQGEGRDLRPTMIKTKRNNMFRAQQYGRWIFVNATDPVGMKGQVVKHHHNILVEQEWYYLASNSPENSYLHKIDQDIDDVVRDEGHLPMELRKKVDFFKTGQECHWKIHLVGITTADGSSESKRAQLLSAATEQIGKSTIGRRHAAKMLLTSLAQTLPHEFHPEHLKGTSLQHKQSSFLEQKKYVDRFSRMSAKGFTRQPSIKFIADLYGRKSLIYQKKREVQRLRDAQIGVEEPPVNWVEVVTTKRAELMETRYWDAAQAITLPTDTWEQMNTAMNPYYMRDFTRKLKAAMVIQKCTRKHIKEKYTLAKEFDKRDKAAKVTLLKQKMHQQNQVLLTGGVPISEEETASVKGVDVTDDRRGDAMSTKYSMTGMHKDNDQGQGTAKLSTGGPFFITEGDVASPLKEPKTARDAIDEERPSLEEYFQHTFEEANQANGASFRSESAASLELRREASSEGRRKSRAQRKAELTAVKREQARSKMAFSPDNPVGLPNEAFDDFLDSGGLTVGVNYLRTLKHIKLVGSEEVDLYGNLTVKKRPSTTHMHVYHSHAPRDGGNSPLTSPVQRKPGSAGAMVSKSAPTLPTMGDGSSLIMRNSTNQAPVKEPIITLRPPPRPSTSNIIIASKKPVPLSRSARAASGQSNRRRR